MPGGPSDECDQEQRWVYARQRTHEQVDGRVAAWVERSSCIEVELLIPRDALDVCNRVFLVVREWIFRLPGRGISVAAASYRRL